MIILRSAVFNAVFFVSNFLFTLAASAARLISPDTVLSVVRAWSRFLVMAVRLICGIRLEVTGRENIAPGAALIASRHQSAFDTFVWFALVPRPAYVLKRELLRIPVFGGLLVTTGMIPIDREGGGSAIRALLRQADQAVRAGRQIVIFPEGTRSEPGSPRALQAGIAALASRAGLPVIPVATNSGLCWGRRAFRKRPGTIRIVIGQPIPSTADRQALLRRVEAGISALDQPMASGSIHTAQLCGVIPFGTVNMSE
jgi:1-acyl-sn-glycerol-3-phosphate acyltransferase